MKRALPLALACAFASVVGAPAAHAATRRLALIAGSNAGNGDRPALRYAQSDAAKMARVLVEVGQVAQPDANLLLAPTVRDLEKAFDELVQKAQQARASDARVLAVFYFSGHGDGEALELGAERFDVARLKARMAQVPADVRLTIVDACRSGTAVTSKGGQKAPAFDIRLSDDLVSSGEVVLASSAANELALESPEVRGSYFTHFLVSGMRGAADSSGDGQVTLAEAYRFAYDHTVAATSATLHDPQHPVYDFRLTGQGELVVASLTDASASIELPGGRERALVIDLARDQVIAEAPGGAALRIAVPPGRYAVRARRDGTWSAGRIELAAGEVRRVEWAQLNLQSAPEVAARGDLVPPPPPSPPAEPGPGPVLLLSLGASLGATDEVAAAGVLRLDLRARFGLFAVGAAALGAAGWGDLGTREVHGQLRAIFGLEPRVGPVTLFGALEAGGGVLQAVSISGAAMEAGGLTPPVDFVGVGALRGGVRLHLGERARIELAAEVAGLVGGSADRRILPGVTLGAGAEF